MPDHPHASTFSSLFCTQYARLEKKISEMESEQQQSAQTLPLHDVLGIQHQTVPDTLHKAQPPALGKCICCVPWTYAMMRSQLACGCDCEQGMTDCKYQQSVPRCGLPHNLFSAAVFLLKMWICNQECCDVQAIRRKSRK